MLFAEINLNDFYTAIRGHKRELKMNQRIKKLWIKALRSGKYKQGFGALKVTEGKEVRYCCLGVLEDVVRRDRGATRPRIAGGYLSSTVMRVAGLDRNDPLLINASETTASCLNDEGKSFKFIADKIEKYL